jgi:hypothetical protein
MPDTKPQPRVRRINRGRGHSYQTSDGTKLDGVTTILGDGIPKKALVGWAGRTVAEYVADRLREHDGTIVADDLLPDLLKLNQQRPPRFRERWDGTFSRGAISKVLSGVMYADRDQAANRGTEVHALAEQLARGEDVDVPDELVGHVDSYIEFLEDWQPEVLLLETVVANLTHGYAGTLDSILRIPQLGGVVQVDIKTNRSGPFGETGLQLIAYSSAELYIDDEGVEHDCWEIGGERVDLAGNYCLWIRADGYDLFPYPDPAGDVTPEELFRTFLYVQQVAHFTRDVERELRGDAIHPTVELDA